MKVSKFAKENSYVVLNVSEARKLAIEYLKSVEGFDDNKCNLGLPEIDDRFKVWRTSVNVNQQRIGEVIIDAINGKVDLNRTTEKNLLINRELKALKVPTMKRKKTSQPKISDLENMVIKGNSIDELQKLPEESVNLVFTSPPYYNAKPEYSEYSTYEEYLTIMRRVIRESGRVLSEGRFFVLNISPVLIRRASRSEASRRIAVPFDFHQLFVDEGFEFIDDIHWVKPEGAGWATGRGRRFSADRNPLQYKPVPVTEYVLVYRKKTDKLIDWCIRKHPDQESVLDSKVKDGYEVTNLWKINPSRSKVHPATFPVELAEKVIEYYSFKGDVVLDPFAGTGTTAKAAMNLERRFVMCELMDKYVEHMNSWMSKLPKLETGNIVFVNEEKSTPK